MPAPFKVRRHFHCAPVNVWYASGDYPARWRRAQASRTFSARNQNGCVVQRFHLWPPSPRIFDAPFGL